MFPSIPLFYSFGGIDAEFKISKEDFEKTVHVIKKKEVSNKLLYLYDCRNLLSTLQNSVIETKYLLGQFYKILNEQDFLLHPEPINPTGIQYAAGLIVTNIVSIINYLFIILYSQLDFITKICYEFENLSTDFTNYPKLKSKKVLFGDRKKLKCNEKKGTIFENNENISMIMTIRNEIIHNASFDNLPKVYQVFDKKKMCEKYILLPDFEAGKLKTYVNRRRFFDDDTKLNLILPGLIIDFWRRIKLSLKSLDRC